MCQEVILKDEFAEFSDEEYILARDWCKSIIKDSHSNRIELEKLKKLLSEIESREVSINNRQIVSLFIEAQKLVRRGPEVINLDDVHDYPKEKLGR